MKLVCRIGEENLDVTVERHGAGYRVVIGDRSYEVDLANANHRLRSIVLGENRQYLVSHHREGVRHEISFADNTVHLDMFDPLSMKRRRLEDEADGESHVRAIMPGRVVKVLVSEGDEVSKGQGLLILEAMKMENELGSPRDGTVASIAVEEGQPGESGDELVALEV